jgi:hypothetical protein
MTTLTIESSRFGPLEIAADAVIEFPTGLVGLGGRRYTIHTPDTESPFHWLHSVDDPSLDARFEAFDRFRVLCAERSGPRGVDGINDIVSARVRALGLQCEPPRADSDR